MIRTELDAFLIAVMYFTRIPCPRWVRYSEELLNRSTIYFPLIGWIVGGAATIIFYLSNILFPISIAILFSMAATVLLTGGFHEDGFSDMCDGFGGGWTSEQILQIMKDSRIGAFGLLGMVLLLALKFTSILHIEPRLIPLVLIIAHSLSRLGATSVIFMQSYAREDATSKVKPVATNITVPGFGVAIIFGILPVILLIDIKFLVIILPVALTVFYMGNMFKKKLGGYTGDCLGATQQVAEVVIYLCFAAQLWKFI